MYAPMNHYNGRQQESEEMRPLSTYHCDQHHRSASHEHLPPAKAINDVVHGDDDTHQTDNAVDASGIQAGR
jgi:hypothetical protein